MKIYKLAVDYDTDILIDYFYVLNKLTLGLWSRFNIYQLQF